MKDRLSRCFRCFTPVECPLHKLEVEKSMCSVVLIIAATMLVVCSLMSK